MRKRPAFFFRISTQLNQWPTEVGQFVHMYEKAEADELLRYCKVGRPMSWDNAPCSAA